MFGISGFELAIVLLFAFLIFGPDKLPQIARTIGRGIKQFQAAQEQMNKVIKSEIYDPLKDLEPLVNPFSGLSLDLDGKGANKNVVDKNAAQAAIKKKTSNAEGTGSAKELSSEDVKAASALPLSSEGVQAALAAEAFKAKKAASKEAAAKTKKAGQPAEQKESFAERRARLEREHAAAKAVAAPAVAAPAVAAPTTSAVSATPTKSATKPASAPAPDNRKEDEKSN